jgi:hypothetical protein
MVAFAPQTIRAQDFLGGFGGGDHSDHRAGARFTKAAGELYPLRHSLVGYVGNGIAALQNNLSPAAAAAKQATFLVYAPFDSTICHTVEECAGSIFASWWSRQYVLTTETQGTVIPTPPPVLRRPLTKPRKLKAFCRTHRGSPRCTPRPVAKP